MSVPLAIAEAAHAAARPARAVSDTAAVTAGVETALAADRRCWGRRLLAHLDDLPASATGQRELVATLAEEFYRAADEIDHGAGRDAGEAEQLHRVRRPTTSGKITTVSGEALYGCWQRSRLREPESTEKERSVPSAAARSGLHDLLRKRDLRDSD